MSTKTRLTPRRTFTLRMTDSERQMFEQAALLSDRSVGALILNLARPGARTIIAQAEAEKAATPDN